MYCFTGYNIRVENQKVVIKVSRCRREQVTVKIDGKDCLVPAEIYYHNEAKVDNQGIKNTLKKILLLISTCIHFLSFKLQICYIKLL